MTKQWIDFKTLKETLDVRTVLARYQVSLRGDGTQLSGFCPLPGHGNKGSKQKSPSFSFNTELKAFQCFGCGTSGNVLEFACLMEGKDPQDSQALRAVALSLQGSEKAPSRKGTSKPRAPSLPELVNAPLGFALSDLDDEHPYLGNRGFLPATVSYFGLGFASRGLMKGRIAIPLHNLAGELVGYAGRIVDDTLIGADCPRYRFPSDRERVGFRYVFRKSELLYNAHRVRELSRRLIVLVEGYTAVWWLHQAGISNAVAVMGASMSEAQVEIMKALKPSAVVLLPDGDEAGAELAQNALQLLSPHFWVRWEALPEGSQPTDLATDELSVRLTGR